jgi:serine/threonine-protein kinase
VHRDVKPSNILLENQVERAVLTDFGLARAIDDASLTQTGILAGTPHYMSPEQATGGPIDHRSDLFSLGAVLYFMATGHSPFRATGTLAVLNRICNERHRSVWQLNKDIPDELCDVVDRLLEKKPNRRPASAEAVQQELSQLLSRAQQRGLGRRRWRRWRGRARRRRAAWAAAFAAMIGLCAAAAVGIATWWPTTPQEIQQASLLPTAPQLVDATELRQLERAMISGFSELHGEVADLERATFYLLEGRDSWQHELESVQQELAELESVSNPESD